MALDILIVDDERDIRELVAGVLSDEGYECRTAGDSTSALTAVDERRPSLVDGRSRTVRLTDAGRGLIDAAMTAHVANEERLLEPLTRRDRDALARLLGVLAESLGV